MASSWKLPLTLVVSVLSLSALTLFGFESRSKTSSTPPAIKAQFPDRISHSITVPSQGTAVDRKINHYDSDKTTILSSEIWYKNGVTSYFYYRSNKKASRMEEYYPSATPSAERLLKSQVFFEDDGILFASHKSWREDGTILKEGARRQDGTYQTLTYFNDGVKVERIQNYTRKRELTDETVFRKDGSRARLTIVNKGGEREVTLFRSDRGLSEIVEMTMVLLRYQSSSSAIQGKVFSDDGKQVVAKFESGSFKTEINYLNPDETTRLSVRFERTVAGHLTLEHYVNDAQVKLSQVYLRRDGSEHGCSGSYVLSQVDEFAADNTAMGRRPFRRIFLADDGQTVKSVAIPDPNYSFMGKGTLYELYPSGFVARKKVHSDHRTIASDQAFDDKTYREPATQVTDRSIFKRADFRCPGPLPVWNPEKRTWVLD